MKNIFFKWLVENYITFPVLLFVDGHSSYFNLQLMMFCKDKDIELLLLYPNATNIIQPLDVALFRTLKQHYNTSLRAWRIDHNAINMKKWMFAPVLKLTFEANDYSTAIQNGFRTCGLYPLDPDAPDHNILNKEKK